MEHTVFCSCIVLLLTLCVRVGHSVPLLEDGQQAEVRSPVVGLRVWKLNTSNDSIEDWLYKADNSTYDELHRQPWSILVVVDSSTNSTGISSNTSQNQLSDDPHRRVRRYVPSGKARVTSAGQPPTSIVRDPYPREVPVVVENPPRPGVNQASIVVVEVNLFDVLDAALFHIPSGIGARFG